jgi:hypothetical protein
MRLEPDSAQSTKGIPLARLCLVLLGSIVGIAAFWHLVYGASLVAATVVVVEIVIVLALAFAYAWRRSQ